MNQETLEGRHAVLEALRGGKPVDRLFILDTAKGLGEIIGKAKEAGAVLIVCDKIRLDRMSQTGAHQGVIATIASYHYAQPEDIFKKAEAAGETPLLVVCDGIQDEQNLGAVIRTCEVTGAHGVVIPKRRSAGLSAHTARASAGALAHIPVARVPGVPSFLRELKKRGVWVYGAAGEAEKDAFAVDFSGPAALVLGNEETGLHELTRKECDILCRLPMRGQTGSLNVSCAAAVLLYHIARTRGL